METIRPAAEAKKIQLQSQLDPDIGTILGDAHRLQQIVWNLLSNAIKFTPEGGQVCITLARIETHRAQEQSTPGASCARISVTDTGRGIHPEFLPYVFDRFRQADSSTTRSYGGLGLGLAIVRHLVELQGGSVYATSPGEGQGATFSIEFPLQTEGHGNDDQDTPSEPTQESGDRSQALTGVRVLVVDDEADTRDLMTLALQQAGANVFSVATAREALQVLPEVKPHVLVSDIGMPEMNGYGLIERIRTMPAEQGGIVPAIALTAYVGEFDQKQALVAGFQRHLSKPIEPEVLIQAISETLQQNSVL
ncbi:ATP-binding response regulator [Egbenema bharatensis]|uniref:ATP-binding response regulator n=1 Tax=Egbenema bharatensis TaxID=3463334 RepID=UPI003A8B370E